MPFSEVLIATVCAKNPPSKWACSPWAAMSAEFGVGYAYSDILMVRSELEFVSVCQIIYQRKQRSVLRSTK